jgi:hypothetical protein
MQSIPFLPFFQARRRQNTFLNQKVGINNKRDNKKLHFFVSVPFGINERKRHSSKPQQSKLKSTDNDGNIMKCVNTTRILNRLIENDSNNQQFITRLTKRNKNIKLLKNTLQATSEKVSKGTVEEKEEPHTNNPTTDRRKRTVKDIFD